MKKFIILAVVVLSLLPLFHSGLFDVHDSTSLVRFYTLAQSLQSGQFPAAWTNLLNQGYGYPLFLYYAPVFSYLGVILSWFTPTYLIALKLGIGVLVLVSGLGMYKLMRNWTSSFGALISSVAYLMLPYHAATLYVRGSYAEGITWAILPWLLYFWSREVRNKRWIAITSVVTALFFMSHNSLPFVFAPFLFVWIFLHGKGFGKQIITTILCSIGLSLWFLLPVFFERGLVQIDRIANVTVYSDHFLKPFQLWHSPWGYGGSAKLGETDGMSFMLGKFQLILAGLTILSISFTKKWNKQIIFFVGMLLFYAFMATTQSAFVWSLLPELKILQFPWRLLSFASFGLAAVSGYALRVLPKKLQVLGSLIIIFCLTFFNLKFFVPQKYINYKDQDFLNESALATTVINKIPEYLPSAMPSFPTDTNDDGFTHTPVKVYGSFVNYLPRPVEISTAYMPQWSLTVDGKVVGTRPIQSGTIISDEIMAGSHNIELTWHRTTIENMGLIISSISLIVVIGLLLI